MSNIVYNKSAFHGFFYFYFDECFLSLLSSSLSDEFKKEEKMVCIIAVDERTHHLFQNAMSPLTMAVRGT